MLFCHLPWMSSVRLLIEPSRYLGKIASRLTWHKSRYLIRPPVDDMVSDRYRLGQLKGSARLLVFILAVWPWLNIFGLIFIKLIKF